MSSHKYTIRQSTGSGRIINTTGDNQRISITRHTVRQAPANDIEDEWENEWDDEDEDEEYSGDEDIIAPIGNNNKVYINGKRVK